MLQKSISAVALLTLLCTPAWAIYKCTGANGKVSYQEAACATDGTSSKVEVRPGANVMNATPTAKPAADPVNAAPLTPSAPAYATTQPPPPPPSAKSALDREAGECLNWYKPKLRDPAGAYFTEAAKQDRVVTISVHGTNGYGGYVIKRAACEIHNGALDEAWTKTHAKRNGWAP